MKRSAGGSPDKDAKRGTGATAVGMEFSVGRGYLMTLGGRTLVREARQKAETPRLLSKQLVFDSNSDFVIG